MKKVSVTKWGYSKQTFDKDKLDIWYRPETSDEGIIEEVMTKNVYQKKKVNFMIEPTDIWLDLGGNIGAFSLFALSAGGQSVCVEPEPENVKMIEKNLKENFDEKDYEILQVAIAPTPGELDLYLCKGEYNKSRHTLFHKRGRASIKVPCFTLKDILAEYPEINAIKMDIEGAEIPILEQTDFEKFEQIKKLVFEYSFDFDKSIPRFMKIIHSLEKVFKTVHYTKVNPKEKEYKFYPPCTNVFCLRE